jgi:hypothetical protein
MARIYDPNLTGQHFWTVLTFKAALRIRDILVQIRMVQNIRYGSYGTGTKVHLSSKM